MSKNLTLKQIKDAELEILIEIDRICSLLNIDYYLAYGTLIGAVRHKGFIPWDDDIDLWLKRKEMDILIANFNKMCKPHFKLIYYHNDDNYIYSFPKICNLKTEVEEKNFKKYPNLGVWVDLFYLDYVSENHEEEDKQMIHLQHVRWMNLYSQATFWKKINLLWGKLTLPDTKFSDLFHRPKEVLKQMDNILSKNNESENVRLSTSIPDLPKIMPNDWFKETTLLEFEGCKFKAPKEYKKVLETIYGDYMRLPPLVEQKFQAHFRKSRYKEDLN